MVGVTGIFERISFLLQKSLFVFHGHRFSFCGIYVAENSFLPSVKELTQMGVTFLLVLLGWILFRSEDISQAAVYLERMFNASLFSAPQLVGLGFGQLLLKKCFFFTALMFIVEWIGRKQAHGLMIEDLSLPVRYVIYTVLLIIIYGFDASNPQGFIYFQF